MAGRRHRLQAAERSRRTGREHAQDAGNEIGMYLDKFRLDGRIALVTGGASGMGFSTAEALAEAGALVTIADLKSGAIEAAKAQLKAKGLVAEGVVMDVTDSARVTEVADELIESYGRIDI